MKSLDFALLLSKYLTQYLPAQRDLSSNTICSYRDTFKLLLIFCRDIQGFNIAKLPMTQLDRKCIEDFILWLRNIRKSSPSTCNQRLCAIHYGTVHSDTQYSQNGFVRSSRKIPYTRCITLFVGYPRHYNAKGTPTPCSSYGFIRHGSTCK